MPIDYCLDPHQPVKATPPAWHLGNRHLAAQIDEDRILIRRDHVIRDMLVGLGATVSDAIDQFQPVHGAYHGHGHAEHEHAHGGHSHSNAEAHSHAHAHSHHSHSHDRSHARGEKPKRDKYGRLPGDPLYGHNHG